ncbi:hypothetical protein Pelo_18860 [Pelomyxa schiedti]|nr:hypothetical protein Pelo_18860 [Pelomyxa schiedti]
MTDEEEGVKVTLMSDVGGAVGDKSNSSSDYNNAVVVAAPQEGKQQQQQQVTTRGPLATATATTPLLAKLVMAGVLACLAVAVLYEFIWVTYYSVYVAREKSLGQNTVQVNATITGVEWEETFFWYHRTKVHLVYQGSIELISSSYCCDTKSCATTCGQIPRSLYNWASYLMSINSTITAWYSVEDSPQSESNVYCIEDSDIPGPWMAQLVSSAIYEFIFLAGNY